MEMGREDWVYVWRRNECDGEVRKPCAGRVIDM